MKMQLRVILRVTGLACILLSPRALSAETFSLEVRSAKLKAAPNYWSASVADLSYGDALTAVGATGAWRRVRSAGGAEGFIHESALTQRTVVLKPGADRTLENIDATDIVLAGKGFCEEVSAEFELQNRELDFERIDRWIADRESDESVRAFLESGGLNVAQ